MAEARAADRAHGPCRDLPPLLSSVPAGVQGGVGVKARAARRPTGTEDGRDQRGHAQHVEDQSGRGSGVLRVVRRRHRRVAACQPGRAAGAARADTAAHRGADYRGIRACANARCSCAADGGTVARRPPVLRHVYACCRRAGYRCAQDHFREHPDANPASRAAAGGAVGGSANSPFFTSSSPLTFQIVKVSSQNRVQLLVCVSVEVFKVSSQDRVPQRFWTLRRSILSGFSPLHQLKKSNRVSAHSSAELGAHSTSSTLSAHQMAHLDAGTTWVDGNGDAWTMVNTVHGSYWLNLVSMHTQ